MTAEPKLNLEELKASVDLVELIRLAGVELKKAGKNYLGLCPFHEDSKPSLSVSPAKNLWNCLGCEAGGDALNFLQLKEKLDFPAAVERLKSHFCPTPRKGKSFSFVSMAVLQKVESRSS